MAAIVLDHKETHEQAGGGNGDKQRQPIADGEQRPHDEPADRKGKKGDGEFKNGPGIVGMAIGGKAGRPGLHRWIQDIVLSGRRIAGCELRMG